jgi:hypothetical protein
MKRIAALTIAAFAACGCAYAGTRSAPIIPVTEAPRDCPLAVSFGSYAMGIDRPTFEKVSALLAHDRGVRSIEQHRWGREGEVTLCARTRGRADARRLFGAIRAWLPKQPRGPVTLSMGPTSYTSPRR